MNNTTQKTQNSSKFSSLQGDALKTQIKENEANLDVQLGLNPPKGASPAMLEIWNDFFILIREMYAWKILEANFVRKYCFDFFEMGRKKPDGGLNNENEEILVKKNALQNMWASVMKKIETIKELQEMEHVDELKRINIEIFDSLKTDEEKIEFLTYLNNGVIPAEVQALIDERDVENNQESQLSPEEVDELQRNAIKNIFGKYNSNHGALNLGKTGNVVSAEAIDEFINQKENEEAQIVRSQTKIRAMPNLPNSNNSSPNPNQNFDQNLQNNIVNSNFTNSQNLINSQNNSGFGNNQNNLPNNSQNLPSNQQFVPQNNIANFGQNPNQNNSVGNFQNSIPKSAPNFDPNNPHSPKAILPRTRGLNDLLKK